MLAPVDLAFWKAFEGLLFSGLVPVTDCWQLPQLPEYSPWISKHWNRLSVDNVSRRAPLLLYCLEVGGCVSLLDVSSWTLYRALRFRVNRGGEHITALSRLRLVWDLEDHLVWARHVDLMQVLSKKETRERLAFVFWGREDSLDLTPSLIIFF